MREHPVTLLLCCSRCPCLQDVYQPRGQFKNAKVAYCIHNIAFQGRFWPESFKDMQLPQSTMSKLGFIDGYSKVFDEKNPLDDDEKPSDSWSGPFNKLNWMKVCAVFLPSCCLDSNAVVASCN